MFRMNDDSGFAEPVEVLHDVRRRSRHGHRPGYRRDARRGRVRRRRGRSREQLDYTYYVTPALDDGDTCAGLPVHLTRPRRRGDGHAAVRHVDRRGQRRAPPDSGPRRLVHRHAALPGRGHPRDQRDQGAEHRDRERRARLQRPDRARQQQRRQPAASSSARRSTPPPILGNGSTLGGPGHVPLRGRGRLRARAGGHGQHRDRERQRPDRERPGHRQQCDVHEHGRRAAHAHDRNNGSLTLRRRHLQLLQGDARQQLVHHDRRRREGPLLPRLARPCRARAASRPGGRPPSQARAAGYGGMVLGQGSNFNNPGHAINFQIYMYGYTDGSHTGQVLQQPRR